MRCADEVEDAATDFRFGFISTTRTGLAAGDSVARNAEVRGVFCSASRAFCRWSSSSMYALLMLVELCLAIEARFLRINSSKASSSGVTAIILRSAASDRGWGSLAEVRVLRILYADEEGGGTCAAVLGRSSSSSSMTDGCRKWLERLLPLWLLTLEKFGGEKGSGVYMMSIVAALDVVDKTLILRSEGFRFERTSKACARPKTISPASSSMLMLLRTAKFRRACRSSSNSSSDDENERQLESCRLRLESVDSLVLFEFCVWSEN